MKISENVYCKILRMPELPDLQVFSYNLAKLFKGKKLVKLNVVNGKRIRTPAAKLRKACEKSVLNDVYREGKELRFEFRNGNIIGLHLMLHGALKVFEKKNDAKFTIAELLFDNGKGLAITDFQGMATIYLNPKEKDAPDALSPAVNKKYLAEKLNSKGNIKKLLMDQHVIRGIGNAYADEILWDAKISPLSVANKIPATKVARLGKSIKTVLKKAEKQIRKEHPDLISGEIRDFLGVHNSRKKESPGGSKIKNVVIGGRKTYYTDEQEVYK
jgi:formamidopyrimidine-DNA glycosylase